MFWTPTNPKCGFAAQIGLCIWYKLIGDLPNQKHLKLRVEIKEGTHDNYIERKLISQ